MEKNSVYWAIVLPCYTVSNIIVLALLDVESWRKVSTRTYKTWSARDLPPEKDTEENLLDTFSRGMTLDMLYPQRTSSNPIIVIIIICTHCKRSYYFLSYLFTFSSGLFLWKFSRLKAYLDQECILLYIYVLSIHCVQLDIFSSFSPFRTFCFPSSFSAFFPSSSYGAAGGSVLLGVSPRRVSFPIINEWSLCIFLLFHSSLLL